MWKSAKCLLVAVSLCLIVSSGVFGRERARTGSPFLRIYNNHAGLVAGRTGHIPVTTASASHLLIDSPDRGNYRAQTLQAGATEQEVGRGFRVPGEFERQQAILLASGRLAAAYPDTLADIVSAVRGRVLLIMLVDSQDEQDLVHDTLREQHLTDDDVRTVPLGIDSHWIRDYGPLFVRDWKGRLAIIDATYDALDRPKDDEVPTALGKAVGIRVVRFPIILDGGNILSNGKGVVLATTTLLQENQPDGLDETLLRESLRNYLGCEHLVMLEPLSGERTGHVDMFVTFTDSRTVVVASCDPETDPVNASVLDQNAACLAAVPAPYGPLRVVRIPMPDRKDGLWRTYNNVIFANGALLVPTYSGVAPDTERIAMQRYREVLPTWDVMGIDASGIIELDGALHCISMNVPAE